VTVVAESTAAPRPGLSALLQRYRGRARRIARAPTILQMEAVECGASSLAMVLAYHGRWVSLEELRVACGVSRDGSKASNILKAARRYGLAGRGFTKEPEQLQELPRPSIIHWNFNHFVVFEGAYGDWASINDPASGRRWVSLGELSEAFTGVVLAFEPTEQFRKGGAPPKLISALWRQLTGSRAGLALVILLSLTLHPSGILKTLCRSGADQQELGMGRAPVDWPRVNRLLPRGGPRSAPTLSVAA